MKLFILEDELHHQRRLERVIDECVADKNLTIHERLITSRPDELLENIQATGNHHLYFLDIDIKGTEKKGLEVAQRIRSIDPYGTIVFITTHSEFAVMTYQYKVAALDFIAKDQEDETFKKSVQEALLYVEKNRKKTISEDALTLYDNEKSFQVSLSDILFFETTSTPHKICLIAKNQRVEFYDTLGNVEKKDERLVKCHRSFVVNVQNIQTIDRKEKVIHFETGDTCFISRRKIKTLTEMIEENN